MAKLIIEGLSTKQAKLLAEWYEGQGEQDAREWFDIAGAGKVEVPLTDVSRKGGYLKKSGEDYIMYCKKPSKET